MHYGLTRGSTGYISLLNDEALCTTLKCRVFRKKNILLHRGIGLSLEGCFVLIIYCFAAITVTIFRFNFFRPVCIAFLIKRKLSTIYRTI